jgi:endoglucanase
MISGSFVIFRITNDCNMRNPSLMKFSALFLLLIMVSFRPDTRSILENSWIRVNLLGYPNDAIKVAVWASKEEIRPEKFELIDSASGKVVFSSKRIQHFGAYGPFKSTSRLNFSEFKRSGTYYIRVGEVRSPKVLINPGVYKNTADFALRYMRQQRSGFNPYLKDSCHTHDGFVLYGKEAGIADSTYFDASGGWHDASDYLQYSTTSANAAYHLLAAYRDFPGSFSDTQQANGLDGGNGVADVLDEARWGLDWLLKMHPKPGIMFNQIADDRDHISMRIPKQDSQYGRGFQRPLYFIDGKPQQRGKFLNNTTGTSSTAAKFASAFSLAWQIYGDRQPGYSALMKEKAISAYAYANRIPGVTQTASVKSPYIYAEDNWVDDMELASAILSPVVNDRGLLNKAFGYAKKEPVTPWMGKDTAAHYQFYPFHNFGHWELARQDKGEAGKTAVQFYKAGVDQVWQKARTNGFYRGVPFIWCSNNLTASFAIQAFLYKQLSRDGQYDELAQANFDWLFGCNIWGTSMVYGLPSWGDTPADPHSAFTRIGKFPIDGGLVDGPVYGNIYKNLIGIQLTKPDAYAAFQSDLVVYHDDYGDYSTNEPTMDGTASLIYLLAAYENGGQQAEMNVNSTPYRTEQGAVIQGDPAVKQLSLVFTGDEFADGGEQIRSVLKKNKVKASFFLTGRFYRNARFKSLVQKLKGDRHYLAAHSNEHLLYCDWKKRDSLLVSRARFTSDLEANYAAMAGFGIKKENAGFFLPPYEWYNNKIADWTKESGLTLVNYTPGTRSNADYTYPEMGKSYRSSEEIYQSILDYEKKSGLNGFMLLMHIGTDERRTDKFYRKLDELIVYLKHQGYQLTRVDELLKR